MPVRPITLEPWTDRRLQKGDAEGCLEFLAEIRKIASSKSAGPYIADDFEWGDKTRISARIQELMNQQLNAIPGTEPLTEAEGRELDQCIKLEGRINSEQDRVTTACAPLKTFIDNHLSTDMATMVEEITTDTAMPIYKQVRDALAIIKNSCLGTPTETRDTLMQKFKMGTARTPADVVTALDNIAIIRKQLKIHHETVIATVNEAATASLRARNPAAPPVMKTCQEPPDRQELISKLDTILDRSSPPISAIIVKFESHREATWDIIVAQLRSVAERHAAQDRQKMQAGPSPVAAPSHSSSNRATTSIAAATVSASSVSHTYAAAQPPAYAYAPPPVYGATQPSAPAWQPQARPYSSAGRPCQSRWLDQHNCCQYELENRRPCIFAHPHKRVTFGDTASRSLTGPSSAPQTMGYAAATWQDEEHTPPARSPSPTPKKGRPSTPG